MKKMIYSLLLVLLLFVYSCEEVVEINLQESEPRLVVEGSLLWHVKAADNPLYIKLTTTAPFFEKEIPPALDASVIVFSSNGTGYDFVEVEPGLFRHAGFPPDPQETYQLEILYNGEKYHAVENFVPAPELEYVEQTRGGFSGEDIELKVFYTDPPGTDNYYLFRFFYDKLSLQIYDDKFTDGNRTFAFFSNEQLSAGDEVLFEIQGISKRFHDYLYILRSQAGTAGGPFQTQPTTVRGNIINMTNPDNFALGYFRLSQTDLLRYRIE